MAYKPYITAKHMRGAELFFTLKFFRLSMLVVASMLESTLIENYVKWSQEHSAVVLNNEDR